MKKVLFLGLLCSTCLSVSTGFASDLPSSVIAPPNPIAPQPVMVESAPVGFNVSGFSVGAVLGGIMPVMQNNNSYANNFLVQPCIPMPMQYLQRNGFGMTNALQGLGELAGARLDYTLQLGNFVIGANAQFAVSNYNQTRAYAGGYTNGTVFNPIGAQAMGNNYNLYDTVNMRLNTLGSLQLMAGLMVSERVMLYAQGGYAFANVTATRQLSSDMFNCTTNNYYNSSVLPVSGQNSQYLQGYVVGGGFRVYLTQNIFTDVNASYYSLGATQNTFQQDNVNGTAPTKVGMTFATAQVSLNYRF